MNDRQTVLRLDGMALERCPAEAGPLRLLVRARRPSWLLVGVGIGEETAVMLAAAGRTIQPGLRLGLLGVPDASSLQRWVRRGCYVYLGGSAGPECVRSALLAAGAHDIVIVDRAFYPQPAEAWPAEPPRGITRREREVLELVVGGLRNREIAAALHLSENTVETHLRSLFSKLQVSTRAGAVEKAIRGGVV